MVNPTLSLSFCSFLARVLMTMLCDPLLLKDRPSSLEMDTKLIKIMSRLITISVIVQSGLIQKLFEFLGIKVSFAQNKQSQAA